MAGIVGPGDHELLSSEVRPELWTVLIAAAGRGTRLGFDKPKILYPVGGKTILERLVRLFSPLCAEFVFILSPEGGPIVRPEIEALTQRTARIATQSTPRGMGDAVAGGISVVETPYVIVVWGDQSALKAPSIDFCMRLMEGPKKPACVCPTLLRARPYIHFVRDEAGSITRVLQQREGDVLPSEGESDAGVFFFETSALRNTLSMLTASSESIGAATGEMNFLPIFPLIDAAGLTMFTARIMSEMESIGVNSPGDAAYLESQPKTAEAKASE